MTDANGALAKMITLAPETSGPGITLKEYWKEYFEEKSKLRRKLLTKRLEVFSWSRKRTTFSKKTMAKRSRADVTHIPQRCQVTKVIGHIELQGTLQVEKRSAR